MNTPHADFEQLIPELPDWNNGKGIDIEAWIGCEGDFRHAIGYSVIFWPRFTAVEQYVLREPFSVESLRGFERQRQGDIRSVEAVMNHLHIADIQYYGCKDITRDRIVYVGRVLREIYEAKLAWQFPDRRFSVIFDDSEQANLIDYEITFFQLADPIA